MFQSLSGSESWTVPYEVEEVDDVDNPGNETKDKDEKKKSLAEQFETSQEITLMVNITIELGHLLSLNF